MQDSHGEDPTPLSPLGRAPLYATTPEQSPNSALHRTSGRALLHRVRYHFACGSKPVSFDPLGGGMTRHATSYILTATAALVVATTVATSMYLVFVLGESFDLSASLFFGLQPALRGIVLAAPAALAFSLARSHFSRIAFTIAASVTAGALGMLLGFWVVGSSPHVSARIAAALLASTWATTACTLSVLTAQSPNKAVAPDANRCFTVLQEPRSPRAVRAGEPQAVGRNRIQPDPPRGD